jgi:UDP-N-acetylglucosamine 4,6-dehydratase
MILRDFYNDKTILVTGGAGSIGCELVSKLLEFDPNVIRVLDVREAGLYELEQELQSEKIRTFICDLRDWKRLKTIFEGVDIVFHAAALKNVPMCEYNPIEAVKTNVIGTQNLIDMCLDEEIEKVIFTSSGKAVNPTTVMGATKLLAERLITSANYCSRATKAIFSSVRFGNVLGSSGSVIPLFKRQIEKKGPVTITDRKMIRPVLLMRDAIKLLLKAGQLSQGGEIFVSKMKVIRIMDLAEVMIEELAQKYGHTPQEIKIKIIGIKPGEKLYEEFMTENEARRSLETDDMYIILPEMKELFHINESLYLSAFKADIKVRSSKGLSNLNKEEIKDILGTLGLF